jgi:hypothetical protein
MSPKSSIGCVHNDYRAYGTFGVNSAPILHQNWHNLPKDQNELLLEPRHLGANIGYVQNDFSPYGMFDVNRAPILHQD